MQTVSVSMELKMKELLSLSSCFRELQRKIKVERGISAEL